MTDAIPKPIPYFLMEEIRRGIITGRYRPDGYLREQVLEREYGVSRGPIREALRLLELRGLVMHEPRHGFRVRGSDPRTVRQLYELRGLLERRAVEALASKSLAVLTEELRSANRALKQSRDAGDVEGYLKANVTFHAVIHRHAENGPLARTIAALNEMAEPVRYALLARGLRQSAAAAEHDRIIALLAAGDIAGAAVAMETHILSNAESAAALARRAGSQTDL
jgi:DNA-binding GntR family transcriptional regulator